jgi:heme/copper-type cytochrome/quinol oxidase subunit 3
MTATVATTEPTAEVAPYEGVPGSAPRPPLERPRVLLVGTIFAIAGIAMMFIGLMGVYLSRRANNLATVGSWLPTDLIIPLTQPNMGFATLVISVVTMQWAVVSIKNDDRTNTYLALGVTLLLGFAYIVEMGYLYALIHADVSTIPGVLIYAITGAHIAMVISAMVFVILMAFRALAGDFTSRNHDGITAAAFYWHSMVAIYAFIWISIFVTK